MIDYIEENFDSIREIGNYNDFHRELARLTDVICYLNRIIKNLQLELNVKEKWLKELYFDIKLSLSSSIETDTLKGLSNFSKLFVALLKVTQTINVNMGTDYLFVTNVFEENNAFQVYNIENVDDNFILKLFDLVDVDIEFNKQIFINNINETLMLSSDSFLRDCQNVICSSNSISFYNEINAECCTWQERALLDMACVEISEEKRIIPRAEFGDQKIPNIDLWDCDYLNDLIDYFNDDKSTFVIETINYINNDVVPSSDVINKHLELAINVIQNHIKEPLEYHELWCTSLLCTIFFFNDGRAREHFESDLRKNFVEGFKNVDDMSFLTHIFSLNGPLPSETKQKIERYINGKQDIVTEILDFESLNNYLTDKDIIRFITKENWYVLSDKFEEIICDLKGVNLSLAFLNYYTFLKKLLKNERQDRNEIRAEIIYIRSLWKDEYYELSSQGFESFQQSFEVKTEEVKAHNALILENPIAVPYQCMGLTEDKICEKIRYIAENPLFVLSNKIVSSEDFPYRPKIKFDNSQIDRVVFEFFDNCNKNNGYKFLNHFDSEEIIKEYFEDIKLNIHFSMLMMDIEEKLYDAIIGYFGKELFLPYSKEITIAYVTQLFPYLEIAIREYGELLAIPSIDLDGKYEDRVRLGSSVLIEIVKLIVSLTGDIKDASDFMFIYYTMFSSNGFNIRNTCIHGIDYLKKGNLHFAFRTTLMSIYLILDRMSPKRFKDARE